MADLGQHFFRLLGSSDNHCVSQKILSITPKWLLKTQVFEKKAIFPVKEKVSLFSSRIIEHDKRQKELRRVQKNF